MSVERGRVNYRTTQHEKLTVSAMNCKAVITMLLRDRSKSIWGWAGAVREWVISF